MTDFPTLRGRLVELRPLEESHDRALVAAASDGELWTLATTVIPSPDTIASYMARARDGMAAGTVIAFAIVDLQSGMIVGSTRFWKTDRANRKLEIGHTQLARSAQRSGINTEAKLLLLRHAFEVLHCVRVQFSTDELNAASRAAILRLGATEEGVLRHERIMPDGRKRNTVRFSIIDDEWAGIADRLEARLAAHAG